MKNTFKFYAIIWAICLALFNVIVFVIPQTFDGAFWIGYIFITLAFMGQLTCSYVTFRSKNLKKLFYNIPLISISYIGLVIMLAVGGLSMAIPGLPYWIGIIACLAVLGITTISVIKATLAAEVVSDVDDKVATETNFIRGITVDVLCLIDRASMPIMKEHCQKVYKALCNSDPVSHDTVAEIENHIRAEVNILSDAVSAKNADLVESASKEIITLLSSRAIKLRASK